MDSSEYILDKILIFQDKKEDLDMDSSEYILGKI